MTGRHEKEYGSEFDNYEEPDEDYEEEDSATESNGGDGFDFEGRPPPGVEAFDDDDDTPEEAEESSESEEEYDDEFNDPFDGEEDDLDF